MINEDTLIEGLIKKLQKKKTYNRYEKMPLEIYQNNRFKFGDLSNLKILILNAPCNGFGDVVFGMKLRNYLHEWYNCDVKIASTKVDNFKSLGEKDENLYVLKGGKSDQCRRFKHLSFVDKDGKKIPTPKADLIFVAPVQMDFDANYSDVKALIPYSNFLNTYFFSEYNDNLKKNFDFHTGVGKNRCGLLFADVEHKVKKIGKLKNPYSVVYIAQTVRRADTCFLDFVEMIAKKYSKKYKKFDIVVPHWIIEEIEETNLYNKYFKKVDKYFDKFNIVRKDGTKETLLEFEDGVMHNTLTLRGDILPLPYKEMATLFLKSVSDILVTGDQSITDVLGCCWRNKLPMYQIVPWKRDFSKELAKHLPQKFLKYIKTSCGTAKAINYHPDFQKFMKSWDFRKLAKPKLDAIIAFTLDSYQNNNINKVYKIFLESKTKSKIIDRLENL